MLSSYLEASNFSTKFFPGYFVSVRVACFLHMVDSKEWIGVGDIPLGNLILDTEIIRKTYNKLVMFTSTTFLFIKYSTEMLYAIVLYVCLSVRLSVRFHDNSRMIRRRMMKLCKNIVEVKSKMELEDGSRT